MAYCYILRCADGTYYVGSTTDMAQRLSQHQEGLGAEYTRRRRPLELAWVGEFESIADAFRFEKRVQGWRRAKREALIDGRLGELPSLSSRRKGA
jgi:putative endonuclease